MRGVLQNLSKESICVDVMVFDENLYILYTDHLEIRHGDEINCVDIPHHPIHFLRNYILADNGLYSLDGHLFKRMMKSCLYSDYLNDLLVVADSRSFSTDHFNSIIINDFEPVSYLIVDLVLYELEDSSVCTIILTLDNNSMSNVVIYQDYSLVKTIKLDMFCYSIAKSNHLLLLCNSHIFEIQLTNKDHVAIHKMQISVHDPISLIDSDSKLYILNSSNYIIEYNKNNKRFTTHPIQAGCYGVLINCKLYCWSEFLPLSQVDLNLFEVMQMENRCIQFIHNNAAIINNHVAIVDNNKHFSNNVSIDTSNNPVLGAFVLDECLLLLSFMNGSRILNVPHFSVNDLNIISSSSTLFAFILNESLIQITKHCINLVNLHTNISTIYEDDDPIENAFIFKNNLYFTQNQSIFFFDNQPLLYCDLPCPLLNIACSDAIYVISSVIFKIENQFDFCEIDFVDLEISSSAFYGNLLLVGSKKGILHVFSDFKCVQTLKIGHLPVVIDHNFAITDSVYRFSVSNNVVVLEKYLDTTLLSIFKYENDFVLIHPLKIQLSTFYPDFCNYSMVEAHSRDNDVPIAHIDNHTIYVNSTHVVIDGPESANFSHPCEIENARFPVVRSYTTSPLSIIIEYTSHSLLIVPKYCYHLLLPMHSHSLIFYKSEYYYSNSDAIYKTNKVQSAHLFTVPADVNCCLIEGDCFIFGLQIGLYIYNLKFAVVASIDKPCNYIVPFNNYYICSDQLGNVMGFDSTLKMIFCIYIHSPIRYMDIKNSCIYITTYYSSRFVLYLVSNDEVVDKEELMQLKSVANRIHHFYYESFGIVLLDSLRTPRGTDMRNELISQ